MPRIDNEQFYKSAIKKYGTTAKGVHWNSQDSQEIRFRTILKMLPNDLHNYTLADAGCGFGDFYYYLKQKPKSYLGVESVKELQKIALIQTQCEIILADITKKELRVRDYYICSGALNILTPFETHQFIANCYKASKIGFIFNTLYGDKESQTYNYLNKEKIQNIAKDLGVKEITYKEAYLQNDITVGFFK